MRNIFQIIKRARLPFKILRIIIFHEIKHKSQWCRSMNQTTLLLNNVWGKSQSDALHLMLFEVWVSKIRTIISVVLLSDNQNIQIIPLGHYQ